MRAKNFPCKKFEVKRLICTGNSRSFLRYIIRYTTTGSDFPLND
jgi:hypothetical protein